MNFYPLFEGLNNFCLTKRCNKERLQKLINLLGSSLEYLSIHRNTETTSPLHRPEEVVLAVPDGLLGVSKQAA